MTTYSVHSAGSDRSDAVFVKRGFRFLAFAFAPVWLLAKGLWLGFATWLAATLAVGALVGSGALAPEGALALNLLLAAFFGLEGGRMISSKLTRAHRSEVAFISAAGRDEAEEIFFSFLATQGRSPGLVTSAVALARHAEDSGAIVGLFPEASR